MPQRRSIAAVHPLRWTASWWSAGSGGRANGALIYSLLCTCKLNNVEPFVYLSDMIARISEHKANRLIELLAWNWIPLAK